jgi:small conductance mechanosensitive channel
MDNFRKLLDTSIGSFTLGKLFSAVITFVICYVVIRILMSLLSRFLNKLSLDKTLKNLLKTTLKITLFILAVIITADSMGIPVTSLVAIFSVAGLAVSLAVQGFLTNLASGISILISKSFRVGDYVEVNGTSGTVREIGLIYTKLLTIDNKSILVPNSEISANKIINYTSEPLRRLDINFYVSHESDVDSVKRALHQAVDSIPTFIQNPPPWIGISAFLDNRVEYLIKVWVKTDDYWDAYYELLEKVRTSFKENGVEMTYDHLNVHLIEKTEEAGE